MKQIDLLVKCLSMVIDSNICPRTPKRDWPKIILQAHTKGYLYSNKDLTSFVCAYRIPYWDEAFSDQMPEEERGHILYVAWAVSNSDSFLSLLKMARSYPNISEIIYYKRNSDKNLKRIKLRNNYVEV